MPIYEYQCSQCGKVTEEIQKFSDPPLTQCRACGGPVQKLVSRTSFQLKGSGWYVTDYKKPASGGEPAGKSDTTSSSSSSSSSPSSGSESGGGSGSSGNSA